MRVPLAPARFIRVAEQRRRTTRRLILQVPADLADKLASAAEISHRTLEQLITDVLASEMARWDDAFPAPTAPEDFQRALDASPAAGAFFATIGRQNQAAILNKIETAKRPEARVRRIEQAVAMLSRGETPYRL
jgi:uncharacterized protein YdeI (YjbR/CyaY-like superfamily)